MYLRIMAVNMEIYSVSFARSLKVQRNNWVMPLIM